MTEETTLRLAGIGVPLYSARGLTQTLEPIDEAPNIRRTINGDAVDLSVDQFHKFKSTISGTDQRPPAVVGGKWPGTEVIVDCIAELVMEEYGQPIRTLVEGSEREEEGFTYYRPRMTMLVAAFSVSYDEWGAQVAWRMDLVEK